MKSIIPNKPALKNSPAAQRGRINHASRNDARPNLPPGSFQAGAAFPAQAEVDALAPACFTFSYSGNCRK